MKITVTRVAQSFVRPSESTPSESLSLSVIDLFPGSRDESVHSLHVFKHGQQPAKVIKEALSKALISYYPLAGRFVSSDNEEVTGAIECNGEGVWFIEAIAGCTLEDVSYLDRVPLMISEKDLLPDPRPEAEPRDVPIMMQVTEFRCGGFVVGLTFVHTVADGIGVAQFMKAIGDFACGGTVPTVNPTWSRHLIPSPPRLPLGPPPEHFPTFMLHLSSFHLPIDYINRIKSLYFKKTGHCCTTFEISAATVWQARTRAINIDNPKSTPVHLFFAANIRHLLAPKFLPQDKDYYGNCVHPMFISATSGDIVTADLVDIVRMIGDAKRRLPEELDKWLKGELKVDPWNLHISYNTLCVSDWTNIGFSEVDYGWGRPTHVIPHVVDGYVIAVLGRPLVPQRGARLLLRCVMEEHRSAFEEHMSGLMMS